MNDFNLKNAPISLHDSGDRGNLAKPLCFAILFAALCVNILNFLKYYGDNKTIDYVSTILFLIPIGAILFLGFVNGRAFRSNPRLIAISLLFYFISFFFKLADAPWPLRAGVAAAILLYMLIDLRIGATWYVALSCAIGAAVGYVLGEFWYGSLITLGFALFVFVSNYLVQLILDHSQERRALLENSSALGLKRMLAQTISFWVPTVCLVALGVWLNSIFQAKIIDAMYEVEFIKRAGSDCVDYSKRSGLERDVYFTICAREKEAKEQLRADLKTTKEDFTNLLSWFPEFVGKEIDKWRPKGANKEFCSNANIKTPFNIFGRKRKVASFGGVCRNIITSIEEMINSTFDEAKESLMSSLKESSTYLNKKGTATVAQAEELGVSAIHQVFERLRGLAGALFSLLLVLSAISYVVLAGALIGSFNLVFGRLLFDGKLTPQADTNSMVFCLSPRNQSPESLEAKTYNKMDLHEIGDAKSWYVSLSAARVGSGTHMRLCIPQPLAITLRRLFAGRLFMTKVSPTPGDTKFPPLISSAGDVKLVCIRIKNEQEVIFHVNEIIAFSSGIALRSIYTAHVAAHFMGLGSFYSVASGEGFLVLLSEGAEVREVRKGEPVPHASLLCWDRRTSFKLAQDITFSGVWFNDPSLMPMSEPDASLRDEGRTYTTGLMRRLWRLLRYLFMPF